MHELFHILAESGRRDSVESSGIREQNFAGERTIVKVSALAPAVLIDVPACGYERWHLVLQGGGFRARDGNELLAGVGALWRTPARVSFGFRAGPKGARLVEFRGAQDASSDYAKLGELPADAI